MLTSVFGMIRIATTRALLLKHNGRNYDIDPGAYFLEIKKVDKKIWLVMEGRDTGLPIQKWKELKGKGVIPKSLLAKIIFALPLR